MIKGFEKLSVIERQDAFLEQWASGEGIEFTSEENRAAYKERAGLVAAALKIDQDIKRVPIMPLTTFAPTMLKGISGRQAMYDPDAAGQAYLDFCTTYQPDTAGAAPMLGYGPALDTLKYHLYKWPGNGVAEHLSYQFHEKEYMKADEFDHLINDPTDFWLRSWMPKTMGALAPLAEIPPVYGSMELPMLGSWLIALGTPPVQEAFETLLKAGRQYFEWINCLGGYLAQILAAGFPFGAGGATKAPFDTLSDSFRGTTPLMMDMYRRPEKVLEAVERLVPAMIKTGVDGAVASGNPLVFIPLHKGADGFMSDEQFQKFYWPTLKAVMYGLAKAGCVPACFVEGAYNQRLDYLAETADIRSMYLFDRTDMVEARKKLGGKVCIAGGFPISLILTGTPEQVKEGTKKLIDDAAGDKGYMLSIGCAMDEAKHDTMLAFVEAGKEYGQY
ncbi:uroporphyrinogen decarboxylase family protein [Dethiosulfatarculus sandiegensis]|uniref:Uroporphyrinogen decarboxylase n=1 Tax=Dethiosulfatarculus sandiegensis TaxID=1429043 RepID=A0A0D2HS33_9BACT|nr:uroporphyrinogen decarboxylase family protein [Dethiosulfatarculus sandiegensis]KIX13348.1 uroporphyrinogen decarboxylase [Dethiosulfatarculus sandiegensis]